MTSLVVFNGFLLGWKGNLYWVITLPPSSLFYLESIDLLHKSYGHVGDFNGVALSIRIRQTCIIPLIVVSDNENLQYFLRVQKT